MIITGSDMFAVDPEKLAKAQETISKTNIPGLVVIERKTFPDGRGYFRETFRKSELEAFLGRKLDFSQGNHSHNEQKGVLRGMHIAPWDKLIYVVSGTVQAMIVDTRPDSETFGQHFSIDLGDSLDSDRAEDAKRASVLVPAGCANGYKVLSDKADYTYLVTEEWYPESERQVKWDDPDFNLPWNNEVEPILSERDQNASPARQLFPEKYQ